MVQIYLDTRDKARVAFQKELRRSRTIRKDADEFWQTLQGTIFDSLDREVSDQELAIVLVWKPQILGMVTNHIGQPESCSIRDFIVDGMLQSIYDELFVEFAAFHPKDDIEIAPIIQGR